MTPPRLKAFISSRMLELAPERQAVKHALAELRVDAWVFEDHAGARPQSIQETYLEELEGADLYIGLFWKGYGDYTVEEFEHARAHGKDCLIYEKGSGMEPARDVRLQTFLDHIGAVTSGLTIRRFADVDALREGLANDVARWQVQALRGRRSAVLQASYANVPPPPDSVMGRDTLIGQLVKRLRQGESLAIEGLPGVGKSTLAAALVAHPGVFKRFKDGVLWANLGPKADLMHVLATWGRALGRDVSALSDLTARTQGVRDAAITRRLLFVLDDVWEAQTLSALRCGGAGCAYLITTRDKAIAPALAGAAQALNLGALDENAAVELLTAMAPEALANAQPAARRLAQGAGGLPLTLMLIGGYLAQPERALYAELFPDLAESALASMLDPAQRLQLTTQRLGDVQSAILSLTQIVELSFAGLPPAARAAFDALGAFAAKPASFDRAAALAVTSTTPSMLAGLAARNLIEIDSGQQRFVMHQLLSDVARARTDEGAQASYRAHYLDKLDQGGVTSTGADAHWREIDADYEQLRHAWLQAGLEEARPRLLQMEAFWARRGLWRDQVAWYEGLLRQGHASGDRLGVAIVQERLGLTYRINGLPRKAIPILEAACATLEALGGRQFLPKTQISLALAHCDEGAYATGFSLLERCRDLCHGDGNAALEADCLLVTANLRRQEGRLDLALEAIEEVLAVQRRTGHLTTLADALTVQGMILRSQGEYDVALAALRRAYDVWGEIKNASAQAETLRALSRVLEDQGQPDAALDHVERAVELFRQCGVRAEEAHALGQQADLLCTMERFAESIAAYKTGIALFADLSLTGAQARNMTALARLHHQLQQYNEACEVSSQVRELWRSLGEPALEIDALLRMSAAHKALGRANEALADALGAFDTLRDTRSTGERTPLPEAKILSVLARRHADRGEFHLALKAYEGAVTCCRQGDDSVQEPGLVLACSKVQEALETQQADIADAQKLLAIAQSRAQPLAMAEAANHLGNLHLDAFQLDDAARCFASARTYWEAVGSTGDVARAVNNLGLVHDSRDDIDRAWRTLREAADLAHSVNDVELERTCRFNAARTLYTRGLYARAIDDLTRVVELDSQLGHVDLVRDVDALAWLRKMSGSY